MSTDAAKSKYPPTSCDTQSDLTKDETNSFFSICSLIRYFKKKKVKRVSFYIAKLALTTLDDSTIRVAPIVVYILIFTCVEFV